MNAAIHDQLLAIAREFYGRLVYTHKTHEKDRERWTVRATCAKGITVALAGVTTTLAIVGAVNPTSNAVLVATCILAGVNTAFIIFQLSFDPSGRSDEHRRAAKDLLILRDRYLLLIEELSGSNTSLDRLRESLKLLCAETSLVYKYSPDSSAKAYRLASKGLKRDEELTFSNDEIDRLLPEHLRLSRTDKVSL
jgi:SMODS and SLOG-associating 2TM effector domain family 4